MKGFSDGRQRLRVGKYRVIFRVDKDYNVEIVNVLDINFRGDIYK